MPHSVAAFSSLCGCLVLIVYIHIFISKTTHATTLSNVAAFALPSGTDILQRTAPHCNTLHHNATHCNPLQHTATHCNTLQHTATHCNALQHIDIQKQMPPVVWLRLVRSLQLQVAFAEYSLFYRALLQKRNTILRSLRIVATATVHGHVLFMFWSVSICCRSLLRIQIYLYIYTADKKVTLCSA